jgi:hypothetical protein
MDLMFYNLARNEIEFDAVYVRRRCPTRINYTSATLGITTVVHSNKHRLARRRGTTHDSLDVATDAIGAMVSINQDEIERLTGGVELIEGIA